MSLTYNQRKWLAIAPKITASISFFSTIFIVWEVLSSKKKREHTYHHFLVALSICDLLIAIGTFLSTWPIPVGTEGVWGASGTQQTCTAQGFFLQLAITAPLYNSALSLYYLLMITFGWSERRLKRISMWVHGTILAFGIATSVAGLPLLLYNNANLWCWIASLPLGCIESVSSSTGETTCIRGDNATNLFRWAFFYVPLWAAIAFSTLAMFMTWSSLKEKGKQAETVLRSSFSHHDSSRLIEKMQRKDRERNVMIQCLFFLGAFYLTWVCPTALRVKQSTSGFPSFGLLLSVGIFLPLQGFFNFLVYLRPRYQRYKQRHVGESIMSRDGIKSMFFENDEDDYNVAPSGDEEDIAQDRDSRSSSPCFRFRDTSGYIGRSRRSASSGGSQAHMSVRFSQVDNTSKASINKGEEKHEESFASMPSLPPSSSSP